MAKKSYNPFKMLGSWIGGLFFFFFGMSAIAFLFKLKIIGVFGGDLNSTGRFFWTIGYILDSALGFLIGWGIHSLIRKYRNKTS